jgi:hypothetical protein
MIKVILVVGLLAFFTLELRGGSSAGHVALRRAVAILVTLLGAVGVFFPGAVTELANVVGVGRGADLVLYGLVITFLFSTLRTYQRISRLERRYTELARTIAIDQARRVDLETGASQGRHR